MTIRDLPTMLSLDSSEVGHHGLRKVLRTSLEDFGCAYREYDTFWSFFPGRPQNIPDRTMVVADLASIAKHYRKLAAHHAWITGVRKSRLYFLAFVRTKEDERYADLVDDLVRYTDARISVCRSTKRTDIRSCLSEVLAAFDPSALSVARYVAARREFLVEFNDGFSGFLSAGDLGIQLLAKELVPESATVGSHGRTMELCWKGHEDLFEIDSASVRGALDEAYRISLAEQAASSLERVGHAIRAVRTGFRMTQTELASQTGIDQALISKLERGYHQPRFDTLERIAKAFKLSVAQLLAGQTTTEGVEPVTI